MTSTEIKPLCQQENAEQKENSARSASAVVRVVSAGELISYTEGWSKLADTAKVANAFYEPWVILPLLQAYPVPQNVQFLLVFGPKEKNGEEPLWGFFPIELLSKVFTLPLRAIAFWQHRWCYLTVPLIDANHAGETLKAFWSWFQNNPFGCRILDTKYFLAEGPLHHAWTDIVTGSSALMLGDFPRAFLNPSCDSAEYLSKLISKKHNDEYLRLERRLRELGTLEYRQLESRSEVSAWIHSFLELESQSWKGGSDGRALAKQADDASFLTALTEQGFAQSRVMLLSLELDGKPIAMKHNLLAADGGFAFRIAYDERFSKYSPGVLLELENIRRICVDKKTSWLDSCAAPRHVMANRIWSERRMIRRTLFSNGSRIGDFWISIFPLLRWAKKRRSRSGAPGISEALSNSKAEEV
jgi:hypothetical protein